MKKALSLVLILALCLSGCAIGQDRLKEPVTFYYLRSHTDADDHEVFFKDGAIGSESREASGHRQDLNYLLAMYLQGPLDPELESPFPAGCKAVDIRLEDRVLTVSLNTVAASLNDMELTIACACLAQTCMGLADADTVHVEACGPDGKALFTRSFTGGSLILEDLYTQPPEATEETQ